MQVNDLPVFYSFRRCPYAIRARMVINYCGTAVELREVLLSNKPNAMLTASSKGTVPVLVLPGGTVLDESLDIIRWAFDQASSDLNKLDIRAIFPFIRQFAFVDKDWFDQSCYPLLQNWLEHFLDSELFLNTMAKYPVWNGSEETRNFINL